MKKTVEHIQGFTLIEIALALMVASMGLLVIMGLFVGGLSAQETAVDETQAALFAEEVLQSLRALAPANWTNLDSLALPAVASDLWKSGEPGQVRSDGLMYTNRYVFKGSEDVQDFAVRYKIDVDTVPGKPNVKGVRLEVWNGEFGNIANSQVYYTEVFNIRFK